MNKQDFEQEEYKSLHGLTKTPNEVTDLSGAHVNLAKAADVFPEADLDCVNIASLAALVPDPEILGLMKLHRQSLNG